MLIADYGACRPAGGKFTVEMSGNRAFTALSYDDRFGNYTYGDGVDVPVHASDSQWSVHSSRQDLD